MISSAPSHALKLRRDFVGKIDVAGSIDQVQLVGFAVLGLVIHRDRMRLDGDAALALEIHRVEQLFGHIAGGDGAGAVQQAIRERGLPVIDMGNDTKISYVRCIHEWSGRTT